MIALAPTAMKKKKKPVSNLANTPDHPVLVCPKINADSWRSS